VARIGIVGAAGPVSDLGELTQLVNVGLARAAWLGFQCLVGA